MIVFVGAVSFVILGRFVLVYFWKRGHEFGVSMPELNVKDPVFLGADTRRQAAQDAVDIGEAAMGAPMHKTTAWRKR